MSETETEKENLEVKINEGDTKPSFTVVGVPKNGDITGEKKNVPWKWNDNTPGEGERPSWVLDKYGNNVETQAKACVDAQKHIGELNQRLGTVPDNYDFSSLEDDSFSFDKDGDMYKYFIEAGKEGRVPQNTMLKLATLFKNISSEPEVNALKEIEKYGPNFDEHANEIEAFIKKFNNEEDAKALIDSIQDISAFKALYNLMGNNSFQIPISNNHDYNSTNFSTLLDQFKDNLYEGDNIIKNDDKAKMWMKKLRDSYK